MPHQIMGRGIRLLDISPPLPSPPSISSSSSSSSLLSSLAVLIIVLSSALILSTSLYLLLRRLSLHLSSTTSASTAAAPRQSIDSASLSLPVFKFRSLATNNNADCAICLASFESDDQLRLLPLCCHAFHAGCIDTWLSSSHDTCPLCRSTVRPTEANALDKTLMRSNSYRIELGSLSRGNATGLQRSYSIGPLEYVVGESYEVAVGDKEAGLGGDDVAGRSWLMDYVDRIGSFSSRTFSRRNSGSFWSGSVRRAEVVGRVEDLEANRIGEEISEIFRWLSGV